MTLNNIAKILKMHSIPYYIKGNRIYADSMIGGTELFEATDDMTDWTWPQLYSWLGY